MNNTLKSLHPYSKVKEHESAKMTSILSVHLLLRSCPLQSTHQGSEEKVYLRKKLMFMKAEINGDWKRGLRGQSTPKPADNCRIIYRTKTTRSRQFHQTVILVLHPSIICQII
jgi:hypothetical protein